MTGFASMPERPPRWARQAVFGTLAAFLAVGAFARPTDPHPMAAAAALAAAALGALAVLGPRPVLVPATVGCAAAVGVLAHGSASNVGWFALCILAGWCALNTSAAVYVGFWLAAMLLLTGELVFTRHDPGWAAWLAGTTFSVVGCVFGRRQHDLVVALRAAQSGLAQRAQSEERNRIARELHDVIAHSLTVSLLHVSAARLAVVDDPEDAARSLAAAERLGRASLEEVRHAVGLLHREGVDDATTPLPGSTDLPLLVDGFRRAGADVTDRLDRRLADVPATIGLATYRIVQESLTNAVRHSPGRPVTVDVSVSASSVEIEVDSAGPPGSGHGLGVVGMRERAEAVGGSCSAGAHGSGWRVHAQLPVRVSPAPTP